MLFKFCSGINCTDPPARPSAGTYEWNGNRKYGSSVLYTCGPYGQFQDASGMLFKELTSTCQWNKTWAPNVLDPCAGQPNK